MEVCRRVDPEKSLVDAVEVRYYFEEMWHWVCFERKSRCDYLLKFEVLERNRLEHIAMVYNH